MNMQGDSTPYQTTPTAVTAMTEERAGKKRGRPSKAEYEQRVREAQERGEVYPPPRKRKTPRPSLEGLAVEGTVTPVIPDSSIHETSTGKRKAKAKTTIKGAATKSASATDEIPGLNTISGEADQMHVETEKEPMKSTIPETQSTDFPARESLLSGMREYATQAEMDTAQSSSTLKGDYSAPRPEMDTQGAFPAIPFSAQASTGNKDSALPADSRVRTEGNEPGSTLPARTKE